MDINSDMGEGMGNDAELLNYITSTNIACGWHAGDPAKMKQLVDTIWCGLKPKTLNPKP